MKKSNKMLAFFLATNLFITGSVFASLNANAEDSTPYSTIIPPIPQDELERIFSNTSETSTLSDSQVMDAQSLSEPVDLSASPYFPPIGDQGNMGSCVAWATTYYQFTFAANKLNNITSTESTAYSPSWIYNWLNNGIANESSGVERTDVYKMLSTRGCLTMADCPYNNADGQYNTSIQNDTSKMIDALKTRLSSYESIYIRTSATPITKPTDTDLNAIKTLLKNGYILQGNVRYNFTTKTTTNNEEAVCAYYDTSLGHGLAIVGYNDEIKCDINGDGTISDGEKGAFKIADSRGTDDHNNGFFWLMYDALNKTSDYSNNTNRVAAFSYGVPETGINFFYHIEVENKPINVVALLDINTNCINNFDFTTTKSLSNPYNDASTQQYEAFVGSFPTSNQVIGGLRSFSGTIPLDYGELDEPANVFTDSNICFLGLNISKRRADAYSTPTISRLSLCDNNMNTITSTTSIPAFQDGTWFKSLYAKLIVGDLDYSKVLSSNDADILLNYLVGRTELSNLQFYLADINKDGSVSQVDLVRLNQSLSSNEQAKFLSTMKQTFNEMPIDKQMEYNDVLNELERELALN